MLISSDVVITVAAPNKNFELLKNNINGICFYFHNLNLLA
jgi:hypothetical protein